MPELNEELNALTKEFYNITASEKYLKDMNANSKIVDLKEIADMLVRVQNQIQEISKGKSFVKRLVDKIPVVNKLSSHLGNEIALQQNITDYINDTLNAFQIKYEELLQHLKTFHSTKAALKEDVNKLDEWIEKATAFKEKLTQDYDVLKLERVISEAQGELKRKYDTITTLIDPVILAATAQTENINQMTPILRNILFAELKTMVGVNAFKEAANMMILLKESIVQIQKLNIVNANDTLVEILESSKSNFISKKDAEEMKALRVEGAKRIAATANEIKRLQDENQKFMAQQYAELKNTSALKHLNKPDDTIDVEQIENFKAI